MNQRSQALYTVIILLGLLTFLPSGPAFAGGLYLPVFGSPSSATANAGANALAMDATTAAQNPAGMTRLDDHAAVVAIAPGFSSVKFDQDSNSPTSGGNGGEQGGFLPLAGMAYVHKLSDRWRLGISQLTISGAGITPSSDWTGRKEVTSLTLLTASVSPTVAVKVNDWLSIGGGAIFSYGRLSYSLRGPIAENRIHLDGLDDFASAPIASVLIEVSDTLRFGVLYQGETDFNLDGDIDLPAGISLDAEIDFPLAQAVRGSAYWEPTERIALMLSVGWEDWSTLKDLAITTNVGDAVIPIGYRDTWYLGGGIHFKLSEVWLLQTGFRYDSSALKDSDRTTFLPSDKTTTLGVGARYQWSDGLSMGTNFTWTHMGDGSVDTSNVKGDYKRNDLYFFGLNFAWSKLPWSGRGTF